MTDSTVNARVLCVGRVYCDLIFTGLGSLPEPGEEHFADGLTLCAGGGAYITAAHLASLGREVSLFANLPATPFIGVISDELKNSGIDYAECESQSAEDDPQITVAMVRGEDRAFLTRRTGAAIPSEFPCYQTLPDLMHLHIGELTTLIENPEILTTAKSAGLTISLDCGWDESALVATHHHALISQVDVFLPNASEMSRLVKAGLNVADIPLAVVKKGALGAEIWDAEQRIAKPARNVSVVDSTGAGDAFNAGFLHHWLASESLEHCLDAGNASGGAAVGHVGGAPDRSAFRRTQRL